MINWQRGGRPVPPPHIVKQMAIREAGRSFGCGILVETGTFMGDMVEAQREYFAIIYSIELSEAFYRRARKRFRDVKKINLLLGDSGQVLTTLVPQISEPAVFWLDGHYSGGDTAKGALTSPVMAEIKTVLTAPVKGHVLLIDDARLFVGDEDYPTIAALKDKVLSLAPDYTVVVEDDIIRCTPNK